MDLSPFLSGYSKKSMKVKIYKNTASKNNGYTQIKSFSLHNKDYF